MHFNAFMTVTALSLFALATNALTIPPVAVNLNSQRSVHQSPEPQVGPDVSVAAEAAHTSVSQRDSVVGGQTFTGTSTCTGDCPGSPAPIGKRDEGHEELEEKRDSITGPSTLSGTTTCTGTCPGLKREAEEKQAAELAIEERDSATGPVTVSGTTTCTGDCPTAVRE